MASRWGISFECDQLKLGLFMEILKVLGADNISFDMLERWDARAPKKQAPKALPARRPRRPGWDKATTVNNVKAAAVEYPEFGSRKLYGVIRHRAECDEVKPPSYSYVYNVMKDHGLLQYRLDEDRHRVNDASVGERINGTA